MIHCKIEGCTRRRKSRGMCNTHYERWRLSAQRPVRAHRPPGQSDGDTLAFIFEHSVRDEVSGCLVWQRAMTSGGYGSIQHRGHLWPVHALVLTLTEGERPQGADACHSLRCISRACVNPEHLRWDTRRSNNIDTRELSRTGGQRLTPEQVEVIRRMADRGDDPGAIAQRFGISKHYLRKILRSEIWKEA